MVRILNSLVLIFIFSLTNILEAMDKETVLSHIKTQLIEKIQSEYPEVNPSLIHLTITDATAF